MSLKKNISGGDLDVPLLDRIIADGEVAEVPDFQPDSTDEFPLPITWPGNRWADADPPKAKAGAGPAGTTDGKAS